MQTIEQDIIRRLKMVTSNSIIGRCIKDFCNSKVQNIPSIVNQIKDQIKDNEPVMMFILGTENLLFFKKLKL